MVCFLGVIFVLTYQLHRDLRAATRILHRGTVTAVVPRFAQLIYTQSMWAPQGTRFIPNTDSDRSLLGGASMIGGETTGLRLG